MAARTARTSGILTAALLLAGAVAAPSAGATEDREAAAADLPHCVMDTRTGTESCFASFPQAIAAATGGQVTDAPSSPRTAAQGDRGRAFRTEMKALQADEVVQGTFFEDGQYGGSSLTIYGAEPCKKDGWVNYQYDLPDDWKNRVSSVQPWADCWLWLYPEPGLGGDRDGPFKENSPDVGSFMNDRAQSIGFS
ncbi:hypothetical protein [Streptomyces sp. NPDC126933]|uniref:hypothetical protein n=1 Tax=unclassified Streptomyces TaxID=2593676 RepID=UPI0036664590